MHLNKSQLLKEQTQQYRILFYTVFLTTQFRSYFFFFFKNPFQLSATTYQAPYLANQGFSNKLVKVGKTHKSVLWLPGLTLIFQELKKLRIKFTLSNVTWYHQQGDCLERKGTISSDPLFQLGSIIQKLMLLFFLNVMGY